MVDLQDTGIFFICKSDFSDGNRSLSFTFKDDHLHQFHHLGNEWLRLSHSTLTKIKGTMSWPSMSLEDRETAWIVFLEHECDFRCNDGLSVTCHLDQREGFQMVTCFEPYILILCIFIWNQWDAHQVWIKPIKRRVKGKWRLRNVAGVDSRCEGIFGKLTSAALSPLSLGLPS